MDEIKKLIVGGVTVLVIGGTGFAVSQTDIANNFAEETGLTQEQAQEYVEDSKDKLDSFSNIGQDFIDEGNILLTQSNSVDCANYQYKWEAPGLSCMDGKNQLQTAGNAEIRLGNCYKALDQDLGERAKPKISECITDIDSVNSNYSLPILVKLLDGNTITESRNTNLYNKSVLRAALEAKE